MRSRLVVIALSILVVGALSAVLTLRASTHHYHASVKGQLLITGGPLLITGGSFQGRAPRPSDGEVTARNASGQSFAVSVPATGKFILQLPAGTYSLTASSPQFHVGKGEGKCIAHRKVTVSKGQSTYENVFCQEK